MFKTTAEKRARRVECVTELKTLQALVRTEERALTEDEESTWSTLEAEAETLQRDITRDERLASLEDGLAEPTRKPPVPELEPGSGGKRGQAPAFHQREDRGYSLLALCRGLKSADMRQCKVEQRASDEIAERTGKSAEGLFVPYRALMPTDWERRNIDKGGTGAGLVGTDLIPTEFVELLRNVSSVAAAGARMLPNLEGDVDLPSQTAGATAVWLTAETTDLTADTSQDYSDTVSLSPKTVGIEAHITRRMLKQSTPGIEDMVRDDIRLAIGTAIDLGAISGTGADGQPTGITVASGTGAVDLGTAPLTTTTWSDIVEFETDLGTANALKGRLGYMGNAAMAGALKTTVVESGSGRFIAEVTNPMGSVAGGLTVNGYPMFTTQQVAALTLIYGNWAEVLIGMWGVLDIFGDQFTNGSRGGLVVRGFQDVDVALRHAASFSVGS